MLYEVITVRSGGYLGRYVVVVDEDVDPTNLEEVVWAMCTRSDPERSLDIIKRAWSGPLDPAIRPDKKGFNSRAIIDATRPRITSYNVCYTKLLREMFELKSERVI